MVSEWKKRIETDHVKKQKPFRQALLMLFNYSCLFVRIIATELQYRKFVINEEKVLFPLCTLDRLVCFCFPLFSFALAIFTKFADVHSVSTLIYSIKCILQVTYFVQSRLDEYITSKFTITSTSTTTKSHLKSSGISVTMKKPAKLYELPTKSD